MVVEKTISGFESIDNPQGELLRNMGKSIYVGDFKLTKSEVTELILHLQAWVETGSLEVGEKAQ